MNTWTKRDLKHNWHPYTQMKDCETLPPILIEKAKGLKLYDATGKYYYDTVSSWWCNIHGHCHTAINKAIQDGLKNLDHIMFAGFTHKSAIRLSEELVMIAPKGLERVFYSDNGSTAVETAMKMSFQYWHNIGKPAKTKFVALDHGYHGDTIGSMSVSGVDMFNKVFSPLFFKSIKVPSPYCYRCPMSKTRNTCNIDCVKPLEKLLKEMAGEISAVILEPMVIAAGGMIIYPKEYLSRVARAAKKNKVHLIIDEVATGFGRTGKIFACEHADVDPDFLCLSKGLTAGYIPLGVTMTTNQIYKAFYAPHSERKTFYHGHTYAANPIGCSVAVASLEVFKKEKTLERSVRTAKIFHEGLEKFRDLPLVGDVRYVGMIGAIELVKDKKTKERFTFNERIGLAIYKEGLKRNLILRPLGSIIYLYLPLSTTPRELKYILSTTHDIISTCSL
jgi:adenosylmethionine-8-amino-7-oxononanoate transaminase